MADSRRWFGAVDVDVELGRVGGRLSAAWQRVGGGRGFDGVHWGDSSEDVGGTTL